MEVDISKAEQELSEVCPRTRMAIYTFFDMFSVKIVNDGKCTISFGESFDDDEVSKDIALSIRTYIKEQKKEIRADPNLYSASRGRRRIFWLLSMFFKHGVFTPSEQSKIMTYGSFVFHESKEDES
jgi:hypothetical protein